MDEFEHYRLAMYESKDPSKLWKARAANDPIPAISKWVGLFLAALAVGTIMLLLFFPWSASAAEPHPPASLTSDEPGPWVIILNFRAEDGRITRRTVAMEYETHLICEARMIELAKASGVPSTDAYCLTMEQAPAFLQIYDSWIPRRADCKDL